MQVCVSEWMKSFLCFHLILLEMDKIISLNKLFNSNSFAFMHSLGLKWIKFIELIFTLELHTVKYLFHSFPSEKKIP